MRIAYFTEVFLPKIDGVVNTLLRLFDYLEKSDHESILFAPHSSVSTVSSTRVVSFPSIPLVIYPGYYVSFPSTKKIKGILEEFQPDIIHLINPVYFDLRGLNTAKQLGIPVVASYQTDFPGYASTLGLKFLEDPIWRYFRKIHNCAELNLAPSNPTRIQMIEHGIERVHVWSRGIDTNKFSPQKKTSEMRNRLSGDEPDKPLLIYVGRLSPEKRVEWLKALFDAGLDIRLALVGDGPIRQLLELQFANTPSVFTGFLQGEELYQAYASADIFVFPSKNETLGNVVLEAMASGLPVIAPTEGGQIDHVIHGKTGLLFDADDVESLVAAVRYLLEHDEVRKHMGYASLEHLSTITWSNISDKLMTDYEQTIRNGPIIHQLDQSHPHPLI
ncbi:MAG: glycosyltransferase family 1 protein [Anaerolineaceae bacterium]|nr:glycosyltransferase family 1 protein [Anaerolineaceae bacterium]